MNQKCYIFYKNLVLLDAIKSIKQLVKNTFILYYAYKLK